MALRNKIELRFSDIDPPAREPRKTIYMDIDGMPDPLQFGITVRVFNYDDVQLYFRIDGSGTGYTFGTVDLGALASGANMYRNLDNFFSRAKPSAGDLPGGELQETVTLRLRGYTDAGYSNLKWTYNRSVTVYFINSADAAFTQDFLNNFDDGTVQGWAADTDGTPQSISLAVATDYAISPPYSLKTDRYVTFDVSYQVRSRTYKAFTTANKPKVFAIINVRLGKVVPGGCAAYLKYLQVKRDAVFLIYLGRPSDTAASDYVPLNKWMRIVVPLPGNTSLTINLYLAAWLQNVGGAYTRSYLWLDDFKIISK